MDWTWAAEELTDDFFEDGIKGINQAIATLELKERELCGKRVRMAIDFARRITLSYTQVLRRQLFTLSEKYRYFNNSKLAMVWSVFYGLYDERGHEGVEAIYDGKAINVYLTFRDKLHDAKNLMEESRAIRDEVLDKT